ncbi:MAG: SUMF1/EgtB/PvdO family nonheme iron enzyme [Deltaproteobacteria bacterium]|nr:SUMF1/EgtB/PvdO family nonheme iron enzyme [Deltaproteobacteria bacterium]
MTHTLTIAATALLTWLSMHGYRGKAAFEQQPAMAGPDCGSATCHSGLEQCWIGKLCVARQVPMEGGFSIDATEVTRFQYESWLATHPSTSAQNAKCAWNSSFAAEPRCMSHWDVCQTGCANHPQVCVDWCDAQAYCKAVGKRLCGRMGGGSDASGAKADPIRGQWYNACVSGRNRNAYPYGDTYDEQACNGIAQHVNTTVEVGTLSECQSSISGYDGVFDLSGNVSEWVDACSANDACRMDGGAFNGAKDELGCGGDRRALRRSAEPALGFRCCSQ